MNRRRAFTLIELLVVMGIILVLISMLFLGLKYVSSNAKARDTQVDLQTMKTLLGNYDQATHFNGAVPTGGWYGTLAVTSPESLTSDALGSSNASLASTQSFMDLMVTVPENKNIIANLPTNRTKIFTAGHAPLLLDGWGDPILFVPGQNPNPAAPPSPWGLTGVTVNSTAGNTVHSPDGRPFFVSAGPDGDVSKGDDNIYSFQ